VEVCVVKSCLVRGTDIGSKLSVSATIKFVS
jgi:hypothetical protein